MKTYLINSLKRLSATGQHLDFTSTIKSHEWIVFNDDKSYVEKFLFFDDEKLLVSVNGKSTYSKWKYIKVNSSLIIEDEKNKYLLKIIVCNKDIIVLNVDSTSDYSFLISSDSSVFKDATYEAIQWYLARNYGIDILNDEQREQFAEEKRIEEEKIKEEKQITERNRKTFLKGCLIIVGFFLLLIITGLSIKDYKESRKSYPTIVTPKV